MKSMKKHLRLSIVNMGYRFTYNFFFSNIIFKLLIIVYNIIHGIS